MIADPVVVDSTLFSSSLSTFEQIYEAYVQSLPEFIPYAPLHAHSGYSLFDGFGTCKQRAARAKKIGCTHLAITDHGSMAGNEEHGHWCKHYGIQAIQGIEMYFMMEYRPGEEFKHTRRHMTVLAKNMEGYKNLCRMQTQANLHQFYRTPTVDFPMLEKHKDGLIVLSGCVLGEVPYHIIQDDMDEARRVIEQFKELFGDDYYLEVQPQAFDLQKKVNEGLILLGDEFHIPLVMTNDSHYVDIEDLDTYMLVRGMGKQEQDEVRLAALEKIREQYKELYISDGREMARRWFHFMQTDGIEYVKESQRVADKCEPVDLVFEEKVPEYIEYDELTGQRIPVAKILARRTKKGLMQQGLWKEPYIARAKEELSVILAKEGKADYYLLTSDMVTFAKENGVAVGPGRGSGSASLVAKALNIIDTDPIEYDLIFERFMTVERATIPDFDVDFGPEGYNKVAAYLEQKLTGRVAVIATVIRYKGANLVNDLAKQLGMSPTETATMKSKIEELGYHKNDPELSKMLYVKELRELEEKYHVCTHFIKIFNNPRAFGQHASGFAVTPDAIEDTIPLFVRGKGADRRITTSYEMSALTRMQIVKVDALKLDTADMLWQCCDALMIRDDTKEIKLKQLVEDNEKHLYRAFTRFDIPRDDKKVFENYCRLNVDGIFQYDTPGAKAIIQEIQPESIIELAVIAALDRPGTLNLKQSTLYAKNKARAKAGKKMDLTAFHSQYCPATFGAMIFQEDIMMICRAMGMSWSEASKVMKNLKGMPADHPLVLRFAQGVEDMRGKSHVKEALAFFRAATEYTFNKSHAVSYALLSYWIMWFKVHYPLVFFLASLKSSAHKASRKNIEADAVSNGIPIFLPHVNGGSDYHICQLAPGVEVIRAGLSILPGVGPTVAELIDLEIQENGAFSCADEFLERVNKRAGKKAVNKTVFNALNGYGALEFDFSVYAKRCAAYDSSLLAETSNRRARTFNGGHK